METMLRRAVENAAHNFSRSTYNWCAVQMVFGYGSTTSIELCKHFGIDPWKELHKTPVTKVWKP